jgi:hypothetical protein
MQRKKKEIKMPKQYKTKNENCQKERKKYLYENNRSKERNRRIKMGN